MRGRLFVLYLQDYIKENKINSLSIGQTAAGLVKTAV
jgi:hypothetical protein